MGTHEKTEWVHSGKGTKDTWAWKGPKGGMRPVTWLLPEVGWGDLWAALKKQSIKRPGGEASYWLLPSNINQSAWEPGLTTQRLLTLMSDLWPPLGDSKPGQLGPNQCAVCTQEGPGKENVTPPKGMEMQISATILDSKRFRKMKNVGVRRLLSWHSNGLSRSPGWLWV